MRKELVNKKNRKRFISGTHLLLAGVCILLGFLLISQFFSLQKTPEQAFVEGKTASELSEDLLLLYARQENLKKRQQELEKDLFDLQFAVNNESGRTSVLRNDLQKSKEKAGFVRINGEGISVVVSPDTAAMVSANMLNQLLNELKAADAIAISVNGERIVATTEIRESSAGFFSINGNLYGVEEGLIILAIGRGVDMYNSLHMIGGVLDKWEEMRVFVRSDIKESITIFPLSENILEKKDIYEYAIREEETE